MKIYVIQQLSESHKTIFTKHTYVNTFSIHTKITLYKRFASFSDSFIVNFHKSPYFRSQLIQSIGYRRLV